MINEIAILLDEIVSKFICVNYAAIISANINAK